MTKIYVINTSDSLFIIHIMSSYILNLKYYVPAAAFLATEACFLTQKSATSGARRHISKARHASPQIAATCI